MVRQPVPVVRRREERDSGEVDAGDGHGDCQRADNRVGERLAPGRPRHGRRTGTPRAGRRERGRGERRDRDDERRTGSSHPGTDRSTAAATSPAQATGYAAKRRGERASRSRAPRRGTTRRSRAGRPLPRGGARLPSLGERTPPIGGGMRWPDPGARATGARSPSFSCSVRLRSRRERPALRPLRPRRRRHGRDGAARGGARRGARRARHAGGDPRPRDRAARRRRRARDRARRGDGPRPRVRRHRPRRRSRRRSRSSRSTGASRTCSSTPPRSTRRPTRRPPRSGRSRTCRSTSLERVVHVNVLGVVVPLPGDRRRDGARRPRLDRQRRLRLRPPLARPGPLRLPARGGRDVLQAGRVLGLEVRAPQPDALPRDLLGRGAASGSTR